MKKFLTLVLFFTLSACGDPLGYRNIEIKNLVSRDIKIEGLGFANNKFFPTEYEGDPSAVIGISHYGIVTTGREKERKFQEISRLKIYYKSKACLLFYLDEKNKEVYKKYINSFSEDKILALTNNGLELLTKDQYEANKGRYTLNDSNVKCLKDSREVQFGRVE